MQQRSGSDREWLWHQYKQSGQLAQSGGAKMMIIKSNLTEWNRTEEWTSDVSIGGYKVKKYILHDCKGGMINFVMS